MMVNNYKILLISPVPPPTGGISTWTRQYINYSNSNGFNIDVVNTAIIGKRKEKINSKICILDEFKRTIVIITELIKKIIQFKPVILHLNTSCGRFGIIRDWIIATIAKAMRISLVVHFHCNIEDQIKTKYAQWIIKSLVKSPSKIFVLNRSSKRYVSVNCHRNSVVMPNFITEEWINHQPKIIKDNIETITFIGHIRPEKGILDIVDVAKQLPNKKFVLAGKVMFEDTKILELNNIFLLGEIDSESIKNLLDNSDLYLFPTKSEGFSISLLEAMARGVPIITTPVGANLEMIENMGGLIMDSGNIPSILESILCLENIKIRKDMSDWNIEKVKKNYSINSVMNSITKEYDDLLAL